MPAKSVQWADRSNRFSRETLVALPHETVPQYVHFWYRGLNLEESSLANKIIESTRVNAVH